MKEHMILIKLILAYFVLLTDELLCFEFIWIYSFQLIFEREPALKFWLFPTPVVNIISC